MSGDSDLAFGVSAVSGEKPHVPPGTGFRQVPSAKLDLVGGTPHHLVFFLGRSLTFGRETLLDTIPGCFALPVRMARLRAIKARIILAELPAFRRASRRLDAVELEVLLLSNPLSLRSLLNLRGCHCTRSLATASAFATGLRAA